MQLISSTLQGYAIDPSSDLVVIGVIYSFDTGQVFISQINGSNIDLTANAVASGSTEWGEDDICALYGLTLSDAALAQQQDTATAVATIQSQLGVQTPAS